MNLLQPSSTEELMRLLLEREERCYFRGQTPHNRILNSTLARELRKESSYLPPNYIPELPLQSWTVNNLVQYHLTILSTWEPSEELLSHLNGEGDPYYEIIRHVQQEKLKAKIHNAIPNQSTPAIEFSTSSTTALFFATSKENEDGAIFCIDKSSITHSPSYIHALAQMNLLKVISPCVITPATKINDLDNPKPKRQAAIYIFQRDLRHPINHHLTIEKIIINRNLNSEIRIKLAGLGINEDYIYARDFSS